MAINSGYLAWLKEEERKKKNPTFKEQSLQDRIIYTDPSFESKSKNKSTQWESSLLKDLSIKQYGRSYNDKLTSYLNEQGLDESEHDEFRKWMDSQEQGVQTTGQKTEGIWNWLKGNDDLDKERRVREANGQEFKREWVKPVSQESNWGKPIKEKDYGRTIADDVLGQLVKGINPFDDVGVGDAVQNAVDIAKNTERSSGLKEFNRAGARIANASTFGALNEIDQRVNDRTSGYFKSEDRSLGGKAADIGYELLGALAPGVGLAKGLRALRGTAPTTWRGKSLEGAILGGAYAGATEGVTLGINPDNFDTKEALVNVGINTAAGAVLDPIADALIGKVINAVGKGKSVSEVSQEMNLPEDEVRKIIRGTLEGQEVIGARSGRSLPPPVNAMRNPFLEGPLAQPQRNLPTQGEPLGIDAPNLYTQRFRPSDEVQIDGTPLLGDGSAPPPPPQNPNDFLLPAGPIKDFSKKVYKSGNRFDVSLGDGSKLSFKANGDTVNVKDAVIRKGNEIVRDVDANELLGMDLGERLAAEELERALKGLPFAKTTQADVEGQAQQQIYDFLGKEAPTPKEEAPDQAFVDEVMKQKELAPQKEADWRAQADIEHRYNEMKTKAAMSGQNTPEHRVKLLKEMRDFADEHNLDFTENHQKRLEMFEREVEANNKIKAEEKRVKDAIKAEEKAKLKKQKAIEKQKKKTMETVEPGDEHLFNVLSQNEVYNRASKKDKKQIITKVRNRLKGKDPSKYKAAVLIEDDSPLYWDVFMFDNTWDDAKIQKHMSDRYIDPEKAESTQLMVLKGDDIQKNEVLPDEYRDLTTGKPLERELDDEYADYGDGEGTDSGMNVFDLDMVPKPKKAIDDLAPKTPKKTKVSGGNGHDFVTNGTARWVQMSTKRREIDEALNKGNVAAAKKAFTKMLKESGMGSNNGIGLSWDIPKKKARIVEKVDGQTVNEHYATPEELFNLYKGKIHKKTKTEPVVNDLVSNKVNDIRKERVQKAVDDGDYRYLELHRDRIRKDPELNKVVNEQGNTSSVPNYDGEMKALLKQHYAGKMKNNEFNQKSNLLTVLQAIDDGNVDFFKNTKWIYTDPEYTQIAADKLGISLKQYGGAKGVKDYIHKAPGDWKVAAKHGDEIADLFAKKFAEKLKPSVKFVPHSGDPLKKNLLHRVDIDGKLPDAMRKELEDNGYTEWYSNYDGDPFKHSFHGENREFGEALTKKSYPDTQRSEKVKEAKREYGVPSREEVNTSVSEANKLRISKGLEEDPATFLGKNKWVFTKPEYLQQISSETGLDLKPYGGAEELSKYVMMDSYNRAPEMSKKLSEAVRGDFKDLDFTKPENMKKAMDEATNIESQMSKMIDDEKKHLQETLDKFNRQYAEWDAVQGMREEAKKIQSDIGKIYIPEENRADWFDAVPKRFRAAKTAKSNMDIFKAAESAGFESVDDFVKHLQSLDDSFRSKKSDFVDSTFTGFDTDLWQRLIDKADESVKKHTAYQDLEQKLETLLDKIKNPVAPPKKEVAPAPVQVEKPKRAIDDLEAPLSFKKTLIKTTKPEKPVRFTKEVVSRKDPLSFVAKNSKPKAEQFRGEWSTKQVDTPFGDTLRMETRKDPVLEDLVFKKPVKKNGPERYKKQVEARPFKKQIEREYVRQDIKEVDGTKKKDSTPPPPPPPPKQEKRTRSADPLGAVAGSIDPNVGRPIAGNPSLKDKIRDGKFTLQTVGQKLKTDFVSDVQFAKDLERDVVKMDSRGILDLLPDKSVKVSDSLYKGLREVRRSTSKAIRWIEDGYVPIFKELNKGKIRQAEFEDYVLAVHANDILSNNLDKVARVQEINQRLDEIKVSFDEGKKKRQKQDPVLKEERKELLQEMDSLQEYILPKQADAKWVADTLKRWDNDPIMKKAQADFVKEQQKDLDLLVAAGVYSKEAADKMKKAHPNYVSMVRDKGDSDPIFGAASNISKPRPHLQRRGLGSEEKIISPIESAVRNRMVSVLNADRNRAMKKIEKMAQVDGAYKYFRKVAPNEDLSKLNTVKYYENGKEVRYEVPQPLKEAFENLSRQKAESVIEQSFKKVGNVIRKGSTHYNIDFIMKSLLRESTGQQAILQSRTGAGLWDMALGTVDSFFGPQLSKATGGKFKSYRADFEKQGGSMTGLISQDSQTQKLAQRALERGTLGKGWHVINPFKNIERLGEKVEFGPKLGEYRSAKKKGYSDEDAMYEAVDVMDYSDAGKYVRDGMWSTVPYLNAAVRGNTRLIQAAKENPGKFLGKGLMYITLPTLAMYGSRFAPYVTNEQREKLNNMPQWSRNAFWHVPAPNGDIYAIPKAHVVAQVFANPVERALDYYLESQDKNVKESVQDTLQDLFKSLAPPTGIPVYTQLIETLTNHQLFLDRPIEDMEMQGKNPEDRYNYYTSEVSKKIGNKTTTSEAFSTADYDHLLKGFTGGVGRDSLDVLDNFIAEKGEKRPSKVKSTARLLNPLDQFKYDSTGSSEIYNRLYNLKTQQERKGIKESLAIDYYEQMHDLNKEIKDVREDKDLSPKDKEKEITRIRNAQRSIGQRVLDEDVLKKKK